jgi:tripartite-type tricarboxylate transporter receptor subunit TctC
MPGLPTLAEQGFPGFTAVTWLMAIAPAGVPAELPATLHAAIARTMHVPEAEQRLRAIGAVPRFSVGPAEAAAYLQQDYAHWGEVVRRSAVRLE